ncbi:MAG: hypothetical protein ACYC25_12505 [Paludibacter sp.]
MFLFTGNGKVCKQSKILDTFSVPVHTGGVPVYTGGVPVHTGNGKVCKQ